MKIGIDASRISLEQKTGTEWYSYYIVKNLLDIDKQNQYFLFSREKLPEEFLKFSQAQNIVLKWPLRKFWTLNKLSLALKNYNLDLFFSPAHNLPLTKIKKVITWHDCGYEYFPNHYSKTQLLSLKMGASGLKKADYIITPSLNTKNDIIKFYEIGEDRIFVVSHGVEANKYNSISLDEEVLNKYGINKKYILYIGRLELKKNIINLIQSFDAFKEKNNDFQLVLVGKQSFGFDDIKYQIDNSKYKDDIKLIGWVNEEDKISLFKKANLFCLISHFEGFGMPLLEAMLCKVPVLVSNLDVFRELGIHDICFTENNIGSINSKMEKLLLDEKLRNDVIEKNLVAVKKFDWQNSAKETLKVFRRLV